MATGGAETSGEEIRSGRFNRAEHQTRLLAQVEHLEESFGGNEILNVEAVGPSDPKPVPGNPLHGIVARGHRGSRGPSSAPGGAGIVGFSADASVPAFNDMGDTGVFGQGTTGVHGHGESDGLSFGRGGVFSSQNFPQLQIKPISLPDGVPERATPYDLRGPIAPGDIVALFSQEAGGPITATLWFCKSVSVGGSADWHQLA
jgi:hypothetical protein